MQVIEINVPVEEIERRRKRFEKACRFEDPGRVPVLVEPSDTLYPETIGVSFKDYYDDPEMMLRSEIYGQKYVLENMRTDKYEINVTVQFGAVTAPSSLGCELAPQDNSRPWVKPWVKTEKDLIKLDGIDCIHSGLRGREIRFRDRMMSLAGSYKVCFKGGEVFEPARVIPLSGTIGEGPFSLACEICRDGIFTDLYTRPEFIKKLLEIITWKQIECMEFCRNEPGGQSGTGFISSEMEDFLVMEDDFAPLLSRELYEEFALPYERQIREHFGGRCSFHTCIIPDHLLGYLSEDLKINSFFGFKAAEDIKTEMKEVAEVMGGRIFLKPYLDGTRLLVQSREKIYRDARNAIELFSPHKGFFLGAMSCDGMPMAAMDKLDAVMQAAEDSALTGPTTRMNL